jgi:hypothetical protein
MRKAARKPDHTTVKIQMKDTDVASFAIRV